MIVSGNNFIKSQWVIKKKSFLGDTYRLLLLLGNGKYYISLGETGDLQEIEESLAEEYMKNYLDEDDS